MRLAWQPSELYAQATKDTNRGRGGYNEVVIDGEQLRLEH